jgi:hypothetical protein
MGIEYQAALAHRDELLRQAVERRRIAEAGRSPDTAPTVLGWLRRRRAWLLWGSHGVRRGVAHGSVGGVRR